MPVRYGNSGSVASVARQLVTHANLPSGPSPAPSWGPSPASHALPVRESLHAVEEVASRCEDRRQRWREQRYALREVLWRATGKNRVRGCGRWRKCKATPVGVTRKRQADGTDAAAFSNIQTCGSVWICPVCSAKIRARRAQEIEAAAAAHLAGGGGLLIGALTVPHRWGDRLERVLRVVKGSFTSAVSGRPWRRDCEEFGIVGFIRTLETTHGRNGWHPHLHLLLFVERPLEPSERRDLNQRIYARFARFVQREGLGRPLPTYNKIGAVVDHQAASRYLSKPIMDLARFDVKAGRVGHRTPFQILHDLGQTGDCEDHDLWREYEAAIPGTHSIYWSKDYAHIRETGLQRHLKERFLIEEETDEALAASELEGSEEETVYFTDEQWTMVCSVPAGQALVLRAMETGGSLAVELVLLDLEASRDRAPP